MISLERMIKVCFKCKEFVTIFPDNVISFIVEKGFDARHPGHPVQVIKRSEIENMNYKRVVPKRLGLG